MGALRGRGAPCPRLEEVQLASAAPAAAAAAAGGQGGGWPRGRLGRPASALVFLRLTLTLQQSLRALSRGAERLKSL